MHWMREDGSGGADTGRAPGRVATRLRRAAALGAWRAGRGRCGPAEPACLLPALTGKPDRSGMGEVCRRPSACIPWSGITDSAPPPRARAPSVVSIACARLSVRVTMRVRGGRHKTLKLISYEFWWAGGTEQPSSEIGCTSCLSLCESQCGVCAGGARNTNNDRKKTSDKFRKNAGLILGRREWQWLKTHVKTRRCCCLKLDFGAENSSQVEP